MAEVTVRMTHEEWLNEAITRFGKDPQDWRFECPFCGNVSSPRDWMDNGESSENAHRASVECIGRLIGARGGLREGSKRKPDGSPEQPCDWAAWGLFGNLGKGPIVVRVVEGADGREERETQAFPFADG